MILVQDFLFRQVLLVRMVVLVQLVLHGLLELVLVALGMSKQKLEYSKN